MVKNKMKNKISPDFIGDNPDEMEEGIICPLDNNKKVAIVISFYNNLKNLKECLDSLKKTNYSNYKIFLVNDSKNIKLNFKDVEIIKTSGHTGFSKAYNVGMRKACEWAPDYILLLNDDTEVIDKNWLNKMVKVGESDKNIGILGCKIIYPDGVVQNIGGYMKGWQIAKEMDETIKKPFEVDHVMGAFMFIKKAVINRIGFLDEVFNPYLLEDTDMCLRAKERGFKVMSVPDVTLIHKKGKSVDTNPNYKRMFVRFKNDIIFSRRHLNLKNKLFRMFIFLPIVSVFRKRKDEDELKVKNFVLRKECMFNIILLISAFFYVGFKNLSKR